MPSSLVIPALMPTPGYTPFSSAPERAVLAGAAGVPLPSFSRRHLPCPYSLPSAHAIAMLPAMEPRQPELFSRLTEEQKAEGALLLDQLLNELAKEEDFRELVVEAVEENLPKK